MDQLVVALELPEKIRGENRISEDGRTALCTLLARLAYPNRLSDLWFKYGWSPERVSRIAAAVQLFIHDCWYYLLDFDQVRLTPAKLEEYAHAIQAKGAPHHTLWGFIDGTIRGIERPVHRQKTCYIRWKRKHCLKYHAIVTPDGLISHFFGPVDGCRNDAFLWNNSQLILQLEQHAYTTTGVPLQVYGDPTYSINRYFISPYQEAQLNWDQQAWNKAMSRIQIVVEQAFKEVVNVFAFVNYEKNQKHLLQPVGIQFRVAVLLHNAYVNPH